MISAPRATDPEVLTYLTLRKAVGFVAVGLPLALAIPWYVFRGHDIQTSISAYYYTGMRNLFVGSLCAISMFMLCCKGYDLRDEIAGKISAFCAIGVGFFPEGAGGCETKAEYRIGLAHYAFAIVLFSTLAYFCLALFRMTAADREVTPQKLQRNLVYKVCGYAIIGSMLMIGILKVFKVDQLIGPFHATFTFESTALFAFGFAWLIKGEWRLKDQ